MTRYRIRASPSRLRQANWNNQNLNNSQNLGNNHDRHGNNGTQGARIGNRNNSDEAHRMRNDNGDEARRPRNDNGNHGNEAAHRVRNDNGNHHNGNEAHRMRNDNGGNHGNETHRMRNDNGGHGNEARRMRNDNGNHGNEPRRPRDDNANHGNEAHRTRNDGNHGNGARRPRDNDNNQGYEARRLSSNDDRNYDDNAWHMLRGSNNNRYEDDDVHHMMRNHNNNRYHADNIHTMNRLRNSDGYHYDEFTTPARRDMSTQPRTPYADLIYMQNQGNHLLTPQMLSDTNTSIIKPSPWRTLTGDWFFKFKNELINYRMAGGIMNFNQFITEDVRQNIPRSMMGPEELTAQGTLRKEAALLDYFTDMFGYHSAAEICQAMSLSVCETPMDTKEFAKYVSDYRAVLNRISGDIGLIITHRTLLKQFLLGLRPVGYANNILAEYVNSPSYLDDPTLKHLITLIQNKITTGERQTREIQAFSAQTLKTYTNGSRSRWIAPKKETEDPRKPDAEAIMIRKEVGHHQIQAENDKLDLQLLAPNSQHTSLQPTTTQPTKKRDKPMTPFCFTCRLEHDHRSCEAYKQFQEEKRARLTAIEEKKRSDPLKITSIQDNGGL